MWPQRPRRIRYLPHLLLLAALLLAGCWNSPDTVTDAVPTAPVQARENTAIQAVEPMPKDEALPPVLLGIPALGLAWPVVPMGWTVSEANGQRSTRWVVPADEVGWHVNSGGAGSATTMLLSGHQAVGRAVFAPLALGEVKPDHELYVTDEAGQVFVYRVVEISEPIPLSGASADQNELIQRFTGPDDGAQVTLITGWPDFTTTHRLFVRAELIGKVN